VSAELFIYNGLSILQKWLQNKKGVAEFATPPSIGFS
jgi:hypothetical protein